MRSTRKPGCQVKTNVRKLSEDVKAQIQSALLHSGSFSGVAEPMCPVYVRGINLSGWNDQLSLSSGSMYMREIYPSETSAHLPGGTYGIVVSDGEQGTFCEFTTKDGSVVGFVHPEDIEDV